MSDDWGDIENIAKPKSQVPKLLFCGCGCLIPILLVILVLLYGMSTVNRGKDTELQWQELQDVLPHDVLPHGELSHDEHPEGFELQFGYQPGLLSFLFDAEVYVFMKNRNWEEPGADPDAVPQAEPGEQPGEETGEEIGEEPDSEPPETEAQREHQPLRIWILMRSEDDDLGEMLDTSLDEISPWSPPGSGPVETLRVQGLDLPVAVVRGSDVRMPWGAGTEGSGDGDAALAIRISAEGEEQTLILLIVGEAAEGVTPEQVTRFLKPFHVGPEH